MKKSALLLTLSLMGCVSTVVTHNTVKNRYAHYGVEPLPDTWHKKSFKKSELLYEHRHSDAVIYINSQCENVSDSPLEVLTAQALSGMGRYEVISQAPQKIYDREALVSEIKVKLDGVERYIKIMVLRKNRCVFDAVFSSGEEFKPLVKDFDAMISTFWVKADL